MKHIAKFIVCIVGIILTSCNDKFEEPFTPQVYDIQGKVEKGPFISGSEISIQPLNSKLQVLGSMFNTSITDDLGNFVLNSEEFSTPYAEFIANGYFYNEVKGQLSNSTLTLRALVNLEDDKTVNVNVLTHLKYARVKNLVASGKQFDEANNQAQKEILKVFGLSSYSNKDVSSFSVTTGTDESSALIAISSLLLMNRSEAEFTEYLSKLSADFGRNGCFTAEIQTQICSDKSELAKYISDIKENIIERYNNFGISINVKNLYYYIDWDNDGVAGNEILHENQSVTLEKNSLKVPNEGGKFVIGIKSPITLYLTPKVETEQNVSPGSSVTIESLITQLYEGDVQDKGISSECKLTEGLLEITVSKLEAKTSKSKTISLYDYIGNVVGVIELTQEGGDVNGSVSGVPLLGQDGKMAVADIATTLAQGLIRFNVIEQYYAYNNIIGNLKNYVNPSSNLISNAWSDIYSANSKLLMLKQIDESRLNVYKDYFNVLSAIYYSNLIYGWDAVPYITDYAQLDQIMMSEGIQRESVENIFNDLKSKLIVAIKNLDEKKNESHKDINGLFFASKDVARVLLANIYMYQGNYKDAKDLLQNVVDNGFYTLDSYTGFKTDNDIEYVDIKAKASNVAESTEVILSFIYDRGTRSSVTIMEPRAIPYITLSDVYLSLAECYYKLGDSNTAEQKILKILNAKNISTAETDVLMRIKDLREQILLYSGTYFAFLKRTGLAKTVCNIEDYQLLFPIPNNELYSNKKMIQNPGY